MAHWELCMVAVEAVEDGDGKLIHLLHRQFWWAAHWNLKTNNAKWMV